MAFTEGHRLSGSWAVKCLKIQKTTLSLNWTHLDWIQSMTFSRRCNLSLMVDSKISSEVHSLPREKFTLSGGHQSASTVSSGGQIVKTNRAFGWNAKVKYSRKLEQRLNRKTWGRSGAVWGTSPASGQGQVRVLRARAPLAPTWTTSCLVPAPKTSRPKTAKDYRPVALTSHVMKTLERLVHLELADGRVCACSTVCLTDWSATPELHRGCCFIHSVSPSTPQTLTTARATFRSFRMKIVGCISEGDAVGLEFDWHWCLREEWGPKWSP